MGLGSAVRISVVALLAVAGITLAISTAPSHAATGEVQAVQSGNWHDPDTWGGRAVPTSEDVKVIPPGITVEIDQRVTNLARITIEAGGELAARNVYADGVGEQIGLRNRGRVDNFGTIRVDSTFIGVENDLGSIVNHADAVIEIEQGSLTNEADLVNRGTVSVVGGNVANSGEFLNHALVQVRTTFGTAVLNSGGVLTNSPTGILDLGNIGTTTTGIAGQNGGVVNNDGTVVITGRNGFAVPVTDQLHNRSGGVIFIRNSGSSGISAHGRIINDGMISVENSGGTGIALMDPNVEMINDGQVIVANTGGFGINMSYWGFQGTTVSGTMRNAGSITVEDSGPDGFISRGEVLNSGTIDVRGSFANRSEATLVNESDGELLTDAGGTFENEGSLTNDGGLVNDGTFDNTASGTMSNSEVGSITNSGTVTNQGGLVNSGILSNAVSALVSNNGSLTNDGGLVNDGTFDNTASGTMSNSEVGSIRNSGAVSTSGVLNNEGVVINSGDLTNTGQVDNGGSITNSGVVTNDGSLVNDGEIGNDGRIENDGRLENKSSGVIDNGDTFANEGQVVNRGGITNVGQLSNDGEISNEGLVGNSGTIENRGTFTNLESGALRNDGSFLNQGNAVVANPEVPGTDPTVGITNEPTGVILNRQSLSVHNVGGIGIVSAGSFTNAGYVTIENTDGVGFSVAESEPDGGVRLLLIAGFDEPAAADAILENNGIITNSGTITNAGRFTNHNLTTNSGTITVYGELINYGTLVNTATGTIEILNGAGEGIQNYGTIDNEGTITVASTGGGSGVASVSFSTLSIAQVTEVSLVDDGAVFVNEGAITIGNSAGTGLLNKAALINAETADIRIRNTGGIGLDNQGSITNEGSIVQESGASYTGSDPSGNQIVVVDQPTFEGLVEMAADVISGLDLPARVAKSLLALLDAMVSVDESERCGLVTAFESAVAGLGESQLSPDQLEILAGLGADLRSLACSD